LLGSVVGGSLEHTHARAHESVRTKARYGYQLVYVSLEDEGDWIEDAKGRVAADTQKDAEGDA
jgi:hypothetical protein